MTARILACISAGFLIGVFVRSYIPLSLDYVIGTLVVASVLVLMSVATRARMPALCACALIGCVLGFARMDSGLLTPDTAAAERVGQEISLEGVVTEEPDVREGSVRLTILLKNVDEIRVERTTRVIVIAPPYTDVRYGDTVRAHGTLELPKPFESGEGRNFNYPMYLAARGVSYQMPFATIEQIAHGGNPAMHAVIALKQLYVGGLRAVLSEPYAGLAAGITAGDKRSVGRELTDVFQRVSLVHILVLSGYNITVVLGAFMRPLGRLSRMPQLLVVLGIVSFFVVVSGGASSAARAAAMAFAAVFAKLSGRRFLALRVLIAVVVGMVLWNPYVLAFDPGFQLSVLATLGLVLFSEHVAQILSFMPESFQVREIAAATLSTQLTVLPLLLYQNGILSLVSLPANLLALIAVPAAMAFSAIAALAGIVLGTWGTLFALPAYLLLRYIVSVADFFASLPYAAVTVPAFSPVMLVCLYAIVFALYAYLARRSAVSTTN